jgi:hypothetical protein
MIYCSFSTVIPKSLNWANMQSRWRNSIPWFQTFTVFCVLYAFFLGNSPGITQKKAYNKSSTYLFGLGTFRKLHNAVKFWLVFPGSIFSLIFAHWGQDSSVGIRTRYGLEGPGIKSRWGRDFLHACRPALGPTQPPVRWVLALFPGSKAARA